MMQKNEPLNFHKTFLKKKKQRVAEIFINMHNVSHQQSLCLPAEKECLATCVQNMQQSDDLSPLEIVDMFAGLSCFLKDSSDVSQTLLDDFRMCQGYAFLCDLMLRYNFNLTGHATSAQTPESSNVCFCVFPDWSRPKRMNQKMH